MTSLRSSVLPIIGLLSIINMSKNKAHHTVIGVNHLLGHATIYNTKNNTLPTQKHPKLKIDPPFPPFPS
jgi:hypothetical protein